MRISYESNQIIYLIEGLPRLGYYFCEPNICTANTDHTISTIVQRNLTKRKESRLERLATNRSLTA